MKSGGVATATTAGETSSSRRGRDAIDTLLLVFDSPNDEGMAALSAKVGGAASVVDLRRDGGRVLPQDWQPLFEGRYIDSDGLRRALLRFFDEWPRKPLLQGKSFDDLFRRRAGYSVWWTSVGLDRNPRGDLFRKFEAIWVADRAIRDARPRKVVIVTREADLAYALQERCRAAGLDHELLPSGANARLCPWRGALRWFLLALCRVFKPPVGAVLRAVASRLLAWGLRGSRRARKMPGIVMAGHFPRYYELRDGIVTLPFWNELRDALRRAAPGVQHRFLSYGRFPGPLMSCKAPRIGGRFVLRLRGTHADGGELSLSYRSAQPLLRQMGAPVALKAHYSGARAWLRCLPLHLRVLLRYRRLEGADEFRKSFTFCGADVAGIFAPRLRRAIDHFGWWEQSLSATRSALRALGNVKAVLLGGEFSAAGMSTIAAARSLGMPTVGVQHGNIMPMHLLYTLPRGQVAGAPLPDHLAVYGEYAKEVVAVHGAFPAERVWITGSSRFDHLVRSPIDPDAARGDLQLPRDKKIILLTTQTAHWHPEVVRALCAIAKDRPEWYACIKVHPSVKGRRQVPEFREIARRLSATNVRVFDDDFDRLLAACDVLVAASSTTLLEAMILGRPAICVNFANEPDWYPYAEEGGALRASTPEELLTQLQGALNGSNDDLVRGREQFLRRHAGPAAQGAAAETLAQLVCESYLGA